MIARHIGAVTRENFDIVDSLDEERWNSFVYFHPKGSVFHTPLMVDVYRGARNHSPLSLAAVSPDGDVLALLVSVRVQTLPNPFGSVSSRSIFYAEPLCRSDADGVAALKALLAEHDSRMGSRTLFAEVRSLQDPGPEKSALVESGYRREDYLNYVTDLRKPKDELWSLLNKNTRRDIRYSLGHGIRVEDVTSEQGVDLLYGFLSATYARTRVPLADKSLFDRALRILEPSGVIKILVVYHEDRPVGAAVRLLYKKTLYAWYRGVERLRPLSPAECLIWHEMEWAHEQGFRSYDSGGAGKPDVAYGVRDFKAKFGGQLVNFGRYQKVYSPWKLAVAERAFELGRLLLSLRNRGK